jgi:hypothetical protein
LEALLTLLRLLLLAIAVLAMCPPPLAQVQPQAAQANPPKLKLEVIPLKRTYLVGETLFGKYKLPSVVDGTLCFPPPATEAQQHVDG